MREKIEIFLVFLFKLSRLFRAILYVLPTCRVSYSRLFHSIYHILKYFSPMKNHVSSVIALNDVVLIFFEVINHMGAWDACNLSGNPDQATHPVQIDRRWQ